MGVAIFMHSVRLVLNDWRTALKITGLLYLIYAIPTLLLGLLFPVQTTALPEQQAAAALSAAPVGVLTLILAIVAFVWIAVSWHRYVLLDEVPAGQLPEFNSSRLLSYAGYSLLLGVIAFVVMFVITAIVGIVTVPLLGIVGGIITGVIGVALALIIGYRLGPILPASAVGKPLTLGQAWSATNGANTAIIILGIISATAAFVIDLPAIILALAGPVGAFLGMLWTLGTGWIKMLVGVSILTTLYGHFIEQRPIPGA